MGARRVIALAALGRRAAALTVSIVKSGGSVSRLITNHFPFALSHRLSSRGAYVWVHPDEERRDCQRCENPEGRARRVFPSGKYWAGMIKQS